MNQYYSEKLQKRRILENAMSGRNRMKFGICTSRVGQLRENPGGAKITEDGVGTITKLFMHRKINSKGCDRTLYQ